MTTQMGKLKKSYSERVGVPVASLRFLFDGRRINDEETPKAVSLTPCKLMHTFIPWSHLALVNMMPFSCF